MRKTILLLVSVAAALILASVVGLGVPNEQARAAFPGKNGKIVFVSNRSGNNEIYTVRFTGNNRTRLTRSSKPDTAPSWSPDGRMIVFTRGSHLYTMHANGTHQRKVPNAYGHNPAFSPSGHKIIYDAGDIYTINVDGTHRTQITDYKPNDPYEQNPTFSQPVWSPVSNKIAFSWSVWIYVMPLSDLMGEKYLGDGPTDSTVAPFWSFWPDWSPDGAQIAFQCRYDPCEEDPIQPTVNYEIYKANANGTGTPTRVTNDPATDIHPAFSPGGSKIVFSSNRDGDYDLYIMNADGTGDPLQLTNSPAMEILPDWQPVQ